METHSAWYLIPPADTPGVNWDVFPEGMEHVLPDENGFRGFIAGVVEVGVGVRVRVRVRIRANPQPLP